ncbi:DUF4129 domain-containing protein [Stenotrophomonas maltophilia]|uniref:DUF4129 domain-containing protein n=1 Tax=Stenotrophomonas TaxID=40323 RepID=UPI0006C5E1AC|nr:MULTISPECIES: DUF4129 domain-containing protein [Stenotrophomonas]KAA3603086.1 DUF4129 domain-containing protein [Stenotrophomonas maltophilia]KOO80734.1 membrane protein [Stenotrophomonas maltophilia]MBN5126354.1 DUF4129 domain-containing protein [Stenotrophomonas maltophilia]MBN5177318.1 DUF4129 domain-containing protein [Stenotrophomonas maltophilia]MCU1122705.1 DUF4129 domain-containing protein [Stenotrophomonas maltophilia]
MRIDRLDVVLRARSGWEAMELGSALSRRHARAVWGSWLLASAPLFVVFNALGWWLDAFGWAWLAMWWCKPLFERAPLYVLSRGIFGEPVGTLAALRAQRRWGNTGFWGYLGWRRFSVLRSLCLPVNLLEGNAPAQRGARRRAVAAGAAGAAAVLTVACMAFEAVLVSGAIGAVFMFMPLELMSESWRAAWDMIGQDTPAWAQLGFNLACWLASVLIGPFYVGAGFGLYLNRRTQMEAWDVEIALRRLRERLLPAASTLALLLCLALPLACAPAHAQDAQTVAAQPDDAEANDDSAEEPATAENDPANTPTVIFGAAPVDTAGFRQAVNRAYEDPLQRPTRQVTRWKPIEQAEDKKKEEKTLQRERSDTGERSNRKAGIAWLARLAEWGLWGLLGVLLLVLLLTARLWLPWLRGSGRRKAEAAPQVVEEQVELPVVLPPDVATQAGLLWDQGRPRQALALLYRASVRTVGERSGIALPPGATEAQCLRASRRMPDATDRDLFARIVRMWQYAAYGGRLPSRADFDALADTLRQQYRWLA